MCVQSDFCSVKNLIDVGSDLNISTEDGSRGASPPFGEAIVNSTLLWRTSQGWASSGWGGVSGCFLLCVCRTRSSLELKGVKAS